MNLSSNQSNLSLGILITIIAYLCFSISSAIVKTISPDFPIVEVVFFQNFFGLLLIIPYCIKRKTLNFKKSHLNIHLIRDISGVLSYITYFLAIQHIDLIDATVLAYTSPFFTPFIWKLWTHEKIEKDVWWTIILGFVGIAFILKPGEGIFKLGAILGILSGLLTASSMVTIRLLNTKMECLTRTLFYLFLVGTIIMLPFAILNWKTPSSLQWIQMIGIGSFIAIGQILLTIAYRHGTASFLSPLSYSMIIFISLISWIMFNIPLGWMSFIGGVLIIVGGTMSYLLRKKAKNLSQVFKVEKHKKWHRFIKKHTKKK